MDSFTGEQYERFEAYRRHALPKQAVRKVSVHFGQIMTRQLNRENTWKGGTAEFRPTGLPTRCTDHCWLLKGLRR
jgi:hypothetical protein